jgi:hypothetical protein
MGANEIIASFKIPSPCPMDWDRMHGDDRVRFCELCGKNVHDLTVLTPDEAASFLSVVREKGERRCVRLYQRADGALTTSSCQPAVADEARPWQFTIRAIMAVIAGWAAVLGLARWFWPDHKPPKTPPAASTRFIVGSAAY